METIEVPMTLQLDDGLGTKKTVWFEIEILTESYGMGDSHTGLYVRSAYDSTSDLSTQMLFKEYPNLEAKVFEKAEELFRGLS